MKKIFPKLTRTLPSSIARYIQSQDRSCLKAIFHNDSLQAHQAQHLFQQLDDKKVKFDPAFMNYYLGYFAKHGNAWEVMDKLKRSHINNIKVNTSLQLARLFTTLKKEEKALYYINLKGFKVYDDFDVVRFIQNIGSSKEILLKLDQLWPKETDYYYHQNMVYALTRIGELEEASKVVERMMGKTNRRDELLYAGLIEGYAFRGDVKNMEVWFDKLLNAKVGVSEHIYKAMISGYLKVNQPDVAEDIWQTMLQQQFKNNNNNGGKGGLEEKLFGVIDQACTSGYPELAMKWIEEMKKKGMNLPPLYHPKLVRQLIQNGKLEKAMEYMDNVVKENNEIQFNCNIHTNLITALIEKGEIKMAEKRIEMSKENSFSFLTDIHAYAPIIKYYAERGEMKKAVEWDKLTKGKGNRVVILQLLLFGYVKAREMRNANSIFSMMEQLNSLNIMTFNVMINGWVREEKMYEALKCGRKMTEKGIKPDDTTYVAFVEKLLEWGNEERAKELLKGLKEEGIVMQQFNHLYSKL